MNKFKANQYFIYVAIILVIVLVYAQNKSIAKDATNEKYSDYNIILVVVDCLRADHLSCYGYPRKTSPNIDAFAQKNILFKQAISQANTTLLSFASIFTSQYVSTHGINAYDRRLSDSALTLAEVLKIYNYKTAAFVGGVFLNPVFRLNQGFDTYFYIDKIDSSFKDVLPLALEWIEERKEKKEKFFLFVHGNDLHAPYSFPHLSLYDKGYDGKLNSLPLDEKNSFLIYKRKIVNVFNKDRIIGDLDDRDVEHIIARYDEGIKYVDGLIGNFLNQLNALKLQDNTIIILTADHGEGLFDHDYFFHDFNLYESTIRVPLIMRIPGNKIKRREILPQVRLIDLMPTILELTGIEVNKDAEGHSLLPLLKGKITPKFNQYIFTESPHGEVAIRTKDWKLIHYPDKVELYNLQIDSGEKNNLAEQRPEIISRFRRELYSWLAKRRESYKFSQELLTNKEFTDKMKETKDALERMYKIPKKFKSNE